MFRLVDFLMKKISTTKNRIMIMIIIISPRLTDTEFSNGVAPQNINNFFQ
jgi:predicted transcriptional regulator